MEIKDNKIKSLSHFDIIRKLHITLNDSIVANLRFSYEAFLLCSFFCL